MGNRSFPDGKGGIADQAHSDRIEGWGGAQKKRGAPRYLKRSTANTIQYRDSPGIGGSIFTRHRVTWTDLMKISPNGLEAFTGCPEADGLKSGVCSKPISKDQSCLFCAALITVPMIPMMIQGDEKELAIAAWASPKGIYKSCCSKPRTANGQQGGGHF